MSPPLLELEAIDVSYGEAQVLHGLSLAARAGRRRRSEAAARL
jgi:hypothetical protein